MTVFEELAQVARRDGVHFVWNANEIPSFPTEQPERRYSMERLVRSWSKRVPAPLRVLGAPPAVPYIYFIGTTCGALVKIGFSDDVPKRFRTLQASCPSLLFILGVVPGGRDVEREFHRRFAIYRRHGEWFDCRDGLAEFVAGLGRMAVAA